MEAVILFLDSDARKNLKKDMSGQPDPSGWKSQGKGIAQKDCDVILKNRRSENVFQKQKRIRRMVNKSKICKVRLFGCRDIGNGRQKIDIE